MDISSKISEELGVREQQVAASIALLDEGATVPFISRYRKEVTGGLDDLQLRDLEVRLRYLRELQERKRVILASIDEQGKLTPELEKKIGTAETKSLLEDLYLPYKPKRRTKAMIAIEAGIEPLADLLLDDPNLDPERQAADFINAEAGFADAKAVLDGAKQILMERFAEDAELAGSLRDYLWEEGVLQSRVIEAKENEAAKFRDYFDYDEPLNRVPSHRALAVFRGRKESFLQVAIATPAAVANADKSRTEAQPERAEMMIARTFGISDQGRAADRWLAEVIKWTW